mmetsp:Transcript_6766/g.11765  ORF Transcript_6766/g.11765 Transcript_6766/m.11765 type:complete len:406 (-) Transcript_6766:581-1798(-)
MCPRLHLSMFFLFCVIAGASGQDDYYQCGDYQDAQDIDVSSYEFSAVTAGAECRDCNNKHTLVPKEIHWHIYPLPTGSVPRHSIFPSGLVQARVNGGVLKYEMQKVLHNKGEVVQAGINLYIPVDKMKTIQIDGVNQFVQVKVDENNTILEDEMTDAEPLQVVNSGVGNSVLLSIPTCKVDFEDMGVSNVVQMDVASDSSVHLSGVDSDAHVKCHEGLTIRTSGVDNNVFVEGKILSGSMVGVDGNIKVNDKEGTSNSCGNITNDGVANHCRDSDYTFSMESIACRADTTADYQCYSSWPFSTAASVGVGVGVLLLIIAMIAGCIFCCCMCGRNKTQADRSAQVPSHHETKTTPHQEEEATHASVIEAEVIEVKSNTADVLEGSHVDEGIEDIEQAKRETVAHTY